MRARATQNLIQFGSQLIGDKRFAQKIEIVIALYQLGTQSAGNQQGRHGRSFLAKARRQLQSIHAGHYHVRKQKMDIAAVAPGKLQRFFTVGREQYSIAGPDQDCINEISNQNIVFCYEDYSGSFRHATDKRKFETMVQ